MENFNKKELPSGVAVDKNGQTELLFNETIVEPKVLTTDKIESEEDIKIPSTEELEELKKTDFEKYLYWIDYIIKAEEQKHQDEAEEIAKLEAIQRQKELDKLYEKDKEWWKN